jgi:protein CpxP
MTDQNTPAPAAPEAIPPIPAPTSRTRSSWTRVALLGSMLVAGVALGAGGLAAAAGAHGWMRGGGPRIERIQAMAERTLDSVGATSDQIAKVHDIIAGAYNDMQPMREKRAEFRKQMIELLKAPTLDAAAIEKARADHIADLDAASKRLSKAVTDVAGVLTPDQRVKVVDRIEAFMSHGPRRPWRDDMHRDGDWRGDHGPHDAAPGQGDPDQE